MKKLIFLALMLVAVVTTVTAQAERPIAQFTFSSVADTTGTYVGTLQQDAELVPYAGGHVLSLGTDNGYFDFGQAFGELIHSLSGNYVISVNVFIPEDTDIKANGNFIWCFANSSSEGYLFLNAKDTRFAITQSDYSGEQGVTARSALQKGRWNNLLIMQRGQSARLYLNGVSASKSVNLHPSDISQLKQNYLGRSCYEGDAYLRGALYSDFRVYNTDIAVSEITRIVTSLKPLNAYADSLRLDSQMKAFSPGDLTQLKTDVELPTTFGELKIEWTSSDNGVITADGHITRPAHGSPVATATLTARLIPTDPQYESLARERQFPVSVLPELSDEETVAADAALLVIPGHPNNVYTDLTLPTVAENGSVVFWKSSDPEYVTDEGRVLKLPEGQKRTVTLTATILKGEARVTRDFAVTLHEREPYQNYLFVYFPSNNNENLYYAISNDGYNFTPLNNGERVVAADTISLKRGVRDPHILRGPDGMFYMVNTDMRSAEGWSSNRGLVMMKSADLVHWQHSTVHFPSKYRGTMFEKVIRVWAPETIWDNEAQRPRLGHHRHEHRLQRVGLPLPRLL